MGITQGYVIMKKNQIKSGQSSKRNGYESGFTLIEITAAIAILVVGVLSVLALYPLGLVSAKRSEDMFIASNQAKFVFSELDVLASGGSVFVNGGTSYYQKKFNNNMFFYLYRIDDISSKPIPGLSINYPANMFFVRLAVYNIDKYAGGTASSPVTPTGKPIETYSSFFAKED